MMSFQMSKSHSSAKQGKQSPSKIPKSDSSQHDTPTEHRLVAPTILGHPETAFSYTSEPLSTSTQPRPSSSHFDRLTSLVKGLYECIFGLANVIYPTNNQVQICLTTIETQLDEIQRKLEESI